MTNIQYTEKTLSSVDRILVDTSTLMSPGFQQFISNKKGLLLAAGKKIIVPKTVYMELARLVGSIDSEKSEHAMAAVELLSQNKDIFTVGNAPFTEEEIAHAFADAQLLSELTIHKAEGNQLLLTNDRKLSCDAFDLNQQQSCKGYKVLVCYINYYGEMQCCECARTYDKQEVKITTPKSTRTVTDNCEMTPVSIFEDQRAWEFDWKSGLISIGAVGILYCMVEAGKAFLKYYRH